MAKKILIVEDNEMNRDMLSRRLIKKGFEILFAVNGNEGLENAKSGHPDLILMDLGLPDMDGRKVVKIIRSQPSISSIPIIALTAHAMEEDVNSALEAGCDDFDVKPVNMNRLLEKINKILG